jgi:cytochrome c oxidase subunit 1
MLRRHADYPDAFAYWNWSSVASCLTATGSIAFVYGMLHAYVVSRTKAAANPWGEGAKAMTSAWSL